jgi:hypothetical protein
MNRVARLEWDTLYQALSSTYLHLFSRAATLNMKIRFIHLARPGNEFNVNVLGEERKTS